MNVAMSRNIRNQNLQWMRWRYYARRTGKQGKTNVADEDSEITGHERKHVIKLPICRRRDPSAQQTAAHAEEAAGVCNSPDSADRWSRIIQN